MRAIGPVLICVFLLVAASFVSGQVVPVRNDRFDLPDSAQHGHIQTPTHWESQVARVWLAPAIPKYEGDPNPSGLGAVAIGAGEISQVVSLPPLTETQQKHSRWDLVLAVDVLGKFATDQQSAKLNVSLRNSDANQRLARQSFAVQHDAAIGKKAKWTIQASSHEDDGPVSHLFDGDPGTIWHTEWKQRTPRHPHWVSVDFGEPRRVRGLRYLPRQGGTLNGTVKEFHVEAQDGDNKWQTIITGSTEGISDRRREWQSVSFGEVITTQAIRFNALSEIRGANFASGAELEFDFDDEGGQASSPAARIQRCFVRVPAGKLDGLDSIKVILDVDSNRYVVVDRVHLFRVPTQATRKLLGKANGPFGPDLLGAGSYGFEGRTVHQQPAISVMKVYPGSPAAQGGLKVNDLIVGIDENWLPPGDLSPGWNWYRISSESLLGRAAAASVGRKPSKRGEVILQVLRKNRVVRVKVRLPLPQTIDDDDYLTDETKMAGLQEELLGYVIRNQMDNGSWQNHPIRTALGGLALLATRDQKHATRIKAAANWMMERHADPDTGFFWFPSFAGIFLSEYYLASGDERVIPCLTRQLRHVESSFHTSKWGDPCLGHGPRGLPYGQKALVAPAVHVLVFESLAKRCGIESKIWETLQPYMQGAWSDPAEGGHGALGYNASYKDLGEFFSRSGLLALALNLRSERTDMQGPLIEVMRKRHPWIRNSHAYGEPGGALGLIALSRVNPAVFEEVLSAYRWWFALAWEKGYGLRYTTPHMGAPYMEGDTLINNAYCIVLQAHRKTLHITGSEKRNWLDVEQIPDPVTGVQIQRDRDGMVRLRCKVPGPQIHYTTDGSEPSARSKKYTGPFSLEQGGVVKARAYGKGANASEVTSRVFAINKREWKVVQATGGQNNARSIERASYAIDGDLNLGWIVDVGQDARGYGHSILLDLGKPVTTSGVAVYYPIKEGFAKTCRISGAIESPQELKELTQQTNDTFQSAPVYSWRPKTVRYLRLEFDEPFGENQSLLMIGEIDIRQ